jgi:hypothetical protein
MALPPELRTLIYEFALCEATRILVLSHVRQPAPLSTYRQIRTEALKIWYTQNHFKSHVVDCDAALLIAFHRHYRAVGVNVHGETAVGGGANWPNLMQWCQAVHEDKAPCPHFAAGSAPKCTVIGAALSVARQIRKDGRSWEECENVLAELRRVVGLSDSRWLKGNV